MTQLAVCMDTLVSYTAVVQHGLFATSNNTE